MTEEEQTDLTAGKDIPPWLQPVPEGEDEAIEAAAKKRRLILTSAAAIVITGLFVSVILYLYDGAEGGAPVHIAAPSEPFRERPDDVGGMQVAHQDKEVFNQVDGEGHRSEVQLGAQPEEPVAELPADPVEEAPALAEDAIARVVEQVAQAEEAVTEAAPKVEAPKPQPVVSQPKPATKPVETPAPAPVEADAKAFRVQLGAYGSEESAARAWRQVRGKFQDQLATKSPAYEAVQSGGRTLYRLRVGPLATRAEADQVCLALRANQQACIVVNP